MHRKALQQQPKINIDVMSRPAPPRIKLHEVTIKINVKAEVAEKVAFIAELQYGCVEALNVADEHRLPVLMIEFRVFCSLCAQNHRRSDRRWRLPPLMMQQIDFADLSARNLQNRWKVNRLVPD